MLNLSELGAPRPPFKAGADLVTPDARQRPGLRTLPVQSGHNPTTYPVTVTDGTGAPGGNIKLVDASDGKRASTLFVNNGANPIEVGGTDVAWGQGVPVGVGQSFATTDNQSEWHAVCAPGKTSDVRVMFLEYV